MTTVHRYNDIRIFEKECKTLRESGFDVTLICTNSNIHELENIKIQSIKARGRFNRMFFLQYKLLAKALSGKHDIYHFHDPELIVSGLILKLLGKTVVYDVHEDVPLQILRKGYIPGLVKKPLSKIVNLIEKNSSRFFDLVICATPDIEEKFKVFNKKTVTIRNLPKQEMFQRGDEGIRTGVCYAGGIGEVRGLSTMLKACEIADVPLNLAGPSNSELEPYLGVHYYLDYHGVLNKVEVNEMYNKSIAGLVVLSYIEAFRKSLPVKMFEYMSAGIPVICSDFPIWRSIIEKHNCGICVDPNDPIAVSEAINFLVDNPSKASEMGRNGRKAIENEFNWKLESDKLIESYKSLTAV